MIACRSLIRVDRAWKAANAYFLSNKSLGFFQACSHYRALSFFRSAMDSKKKAKTMDSVWRPVSAKSSFQEDGSENPCLEVSCDEKSEVGVQVQVAHSSTSDSLSEVQGNGKNDPMARELADASSLREAVEEEERSKLSANVEMDRVHSVNEITSNSVSVEVAASLVRFIKGKGGSTQRQIEEEMGVKLIFPSSKKESFIVIEGASVESVTKASNKIQVVLEEAIKSPNLDYSHFISLPLAIHPELVDKLTYFQNSILGNCDYSKDGNMGSESEGDTPDDEDNSVQLDGGLDMSVKLKVDESEQVKVETNKVHFISYFPKASKSSKLSGLGIGRSIFIKPKTFHLTVLMLKLWSKERVATATEVLQRVSSKVMNALESRPVFVRLKGLVPVGSSVCEMNQIKKISLKYATRFSKECMKGSLAKARVLYAPVEAVGGEDRLLRACQIITDAFVEAGLVLEKDAQNKLKLHGTVMNARHRKRTKGRKGPDSFDARGIVKQYGSKEWGEYLIREAHLSERFVYDDNGYYHCCGSIRFPENNQVE